MKRLIMLSIALMLLLVGCNKEGESGWTINLEDGVPSKNSSSISSTDSYSSEINTSSAVAVTVTVERNDTHLIYSEFTYDLIEYINNNSAGVIGNGNGEMVLNVFDVNFNIFGYISSDAVDSSAKMYCRKSDLSEGVEIYTDRPSYISEYNITCGTIDYARKLAAEDIEIFKNFCGDDAVLYKVGNGLEVGSVDPSELSCSKGIIATFYKEDRVATLLKLNITENSDIVYQCTVEVFCNDIA